MSTEDNLPPPDFSRSYLPGDQVLHQELEGEAVLLNLENESYYGLDEVGTRAWMLLIEYGNLQKVFDVMVDEYDIDSETLKNDLSVLVASLLENGLLRSSPE